MIFIRYIDLFLVNKQQSYPNHILHPEVIPSLNEVPDELNKRRNIRSNDPLAIENYEAEMPLLVASSLHEELRRAVQNMLEEKFCFFLFVIMLLFMNRAAQGRNVDDVPSNLSNSFQAIQTPERASRSIGFDQQQSFLTSALSQDRTSLTEVFQRIKIAGDFHDLSHIEDLEESATPLIRALVVREKYENEGEDFIITFIFRLDTWHSVYNHFRNQWKIS